MSKKVEETSEFPIGALEESISKTQGDAKGKKKAKEPGRDIETRLKFLTKMYTSNKDKTADEEPEDDEDE